MSQGVALIQEGLIKLGYDPGPVDGIPGPKTFAAWDAARAAKGLPNRRSTDLPWMDEGRAVFGLHEVRDNAKLRAWLKSDGKTLGDPAALPWCGDFVETCIRRAMPDEPLPGALGANPYWARNWLAFGVYSPRTYGAVAVFSRESGGHVGFLVGEDDQDVYVLGGNQGNAVNITRIAKSRLLGCRWPSTVPASTKPLPRMTPGSIPKSINEF